MPARRGVEEDAAECDRDEQRTESVYDEGRGCAMLGEDVPTDERRREWHDADGDEEQQIQIEERPIRTLAVLEQRVVIDPDDPDCREADWYAAYAGQR